jgi:phosphoglycolate phosphatase (TIGR01487 family)
MNEIKALALDIDGTITDSHRKLCINAIKSIRKVENNGIPVILVTGNTAVYTYAITTSIGTTGGVVGENGGVMFLEGYKNNETIVYSDFNYVKKAYQHLKEKIGEENQLIIVDDQYSRLSEIAFYRTMNADKIREILKDWNIKVYDSGFALHITDNKINKGITLEKLAKILKINPENIMGIGDSENDLDFLDHVGVKIAVANASQELKDKADYVCQKPYGDGVAEAIEKFILNKN